MGADRIELYTEPFAQGVCAGRPTPPATASRRYSAVATLAHELGLGVNAGHDLDLDNLVLFRSLPHLDEVSIGHALISRALFVGLDRSVRDYLAALRRVSVRVIASPAGRSRVVPRAGDRRRSSSRPRLPRRPRSA